MAGKPRREGPQEDDQQLLYTHKCDLFDTAFGTSDGTWCPQMENQQQWVQDPQRSQPPQPRLHRANVRDDRIQGLPRAGAKCRVPSTYPTHFWLLLCSFSDVLRETFLPMDSVTRKVDNLYFRLLGGAMSAYNALDQNNTCWVS